MLSHAVFVLPRGSPGYTWVVQVFVAGKVEDGLASCSLPGLVSAKWYPCCISFLKVLKFIL